MLTREYDCVNNSTFVYTLWIFSQDMIKLIIINVHAVFHCFAYTCHEALCINLKVILNHVHSNSTVVNINVNKLRVIIMAPLTKHILVR